MILSRNILQRVGESGHPCRTPTVVRNQSPMLLLKRIALVLVLVGCCLLQLTSLSSDFLLPFSCTFSCCCSLPCISQTFMFESFLSQFSTQVGFFFPPMTVHHALANKKFNTMLVFILLTTEKSPVFSQGLFRQNSSNTFHRVQGCSTRTCSFRVLIS